VLFLVLNEVLVVVSNILLIDCYGLHLMLFIMIDSGWYLCCLLELSPPGLVESASLPAMLGQWLPAPQLSQVVA